MLEGTHKVLLPYVTSLKIGLFFSPNVMGKKGDIARKR